MLLLLLLLYDLDDDEMVVAEDTDAREYKLGVVLLLYKYKNKKVKNIIINECL